MTISKFRPAPRIAEQHEVCCRAGRGHKNYDEQLVELFGGGWYRTECPACQWELLYNKPKEDERRQAAEKAAAEHELSQDLIATGITPRFRGCTFDNFLTDGGDAGKTRALSICRGYAEKFAEHYRQGRALMLLGEIGNGKTHLACAILQHIVREEQATGLIVTAEAIIQGVTDSFRQNASHTKSQLLQELAEVDLLVIDEVGMHTPRQGRDFAPGLLHEVIDWRYQLVLPTVLVSNQTRERLPEFIGPRAADRLRENGGLLAPFTWRSARLGGAA